MRAVIAVTVAAALAVGISTGTCIIVDNTGRDDPSCLQSNTSSGLGCKTLAYVITNAFSLNDSEIILLGNHSLTQTLTLLHVEGLTIRGDGERASVIKCAYPSHPNDQGCGLVVRFSTRLQIFNVSFERCGTLQFSTTVREYKNVKYRSAVYITESTDILLSKTSFLMSIGRGLSMHDVDGHVKVSSSYFMGNMVPLNENILFGGGSVYIEFTYCPPGVSKCDPESNVHNKNSRYLIEDSVFEGNVATNREVTEQSHIVQFRILPGSDGNNAGQGGGLHVIIKGSSSNNTITVRNCHFYNNSAVWGGGIDAIFLDRATNNTFTVNRCTFENNHAPDRGGGALQLGFYGAENILHNSIVVQDTEFVNNSAGWGAAVAFFSSRSEKGLNTSVTFINCVFERNSASIGAAVHLKPEARQSVYEGRTPTAIFSNCTFTNNRVLYTGTFLNIANDDISQHVLESGTIDIESLEIDFVNYVSFTNNRGSAIVANSAQVNVLENTKVEFVNNTATNGGAMALLGFSILELYPGSQVLFDSNNASELGGAVYATSPHQTEFIFSHKCFVSFKGRYFNDPDKWNTTITFAHNSAKYGYAIFTDSVLPCVKLIGGIYTNITAAFQWNTFKITPFTDQYTIATSPASINFTLPQEISPGETINIHPISLDDLNQYIPIAFKVMLESFGGAARTNPFISDDGHLLISGEPGTTFTLTLQTQNTRHVSVTKSGKLGNCPLGFTLVNSSVCVCSASLPNKGLVGVRGCDYVKFWALLQIGYWVGCTRSQNAITGVCPLSFCSYQASSVPIPRTCRDLKQSHVCVNHRRGQLCGECKEGYSVYTNSDKYHCGECPYGALGILAYLATEIVPLFVLFVVVMALKLKITSGVAQSFLLFAQIFFLINQAPSLKPLSDTSSTFLRIHTFILGFFNLAFFHLDEISFCLWREATALDIIAFKYVTTLSTMLFLAIFIVIVNQKSVPARSLARPCSCFAKIHTFTKKMKLFQNSIVHGISTFLILSYTQYTATSFQILNRIPLYGEGGVRFKSVVFYQGSVDYFGPGHLRYAIPAVLVLVFLSLPPPLLLISYPLLWKLKAKLRQNSATDDDTTIWPIRKLLPLIDSFQGVFRDNCRMFAGLLFLWRVILTATFIFSSDLTQLFFQTETALLIMFTIHTLARPYKKRLENITDGMMLANMAVIISLKWYTSVPSTGDISNRVFELLITIQLLLMYMPLVTFGGFATFWVLRRFNMFPNQFKCFSTEDDPNINNHDTPHIRRKVTLKRQEMCKDEDLFSRAAEMNTLPSSVTCSEAAIEFETNRTTFTTLGTDN